MALHTKKQFAELCGLTTGNLSVYKDRQKVVYSGDYIDDSIEPNLSFLKLRKEKLQTDKVPSVKAKVEPKITQRKIEKPVADAPRVPSVQTDDKDAVVYNLTQEKIKTQITKMQMEMDKLKMQNSKFMGEVIPTALIKPCILQHNQSIISQSKITIDNLKRIIIKKFNVPPEVAAEFETTCIGELNEMMRKATQVTVKAINNIVHDFAGKRSVGERT